MILVKFEINTYINDKPNKIRIMVLSGRDAEGISHERTLSRERGKGDFEGYRHPIS